MSCGMDERVRWDVEGGPKGGGNADDGNGIAVQSKTHPLVPENPGTSIDGYLRICGLGSGTGWGRGSRDVFSPS